MPASVIPMATSGCLCSRSTSRTECFKSQAGLLEVADKWVILTDAPAFNFASS